MHKSKRICGSTISNSEFISLTDCPFCHSSQQFSNLINRALYIKYSASQNYYYQKDINLILIHQPSRQYTLFKEWSYYEQGECLKRFYVISEYKQKTMVLTEYYKFHKDIPRLFMLPICTMLSKYHDKKRRIEYIRITRMLGGQIDEPIKTQQSIQSSLQNLLGQLNFTKHETSNTIIEIQNNLKEAINTQQKNIKQNKIYNLPLQLKHLDNYNRSKNDQYSETNSRNEQKENFIELKKKLKNSGIQTQRESSQPKICYTDRFLKQSQQIPLTQRNLNTNRQSISPKPNVNCIKPQIMQLLKPNHTNNNKLKATNIILECLMRKLNLENKLTQRLKSKSPQMKVQTSIQQPKRKRRVMSTNQETSTKIDITIIKSKQQSQLQNNKGYKTGRASVLI